MTDIPFRVYGPQPLNAGAGETLYTAPTGTNKVFIRDITLTNLHPSSITVRMSVGSITDPSKRVVDQAVATGTPVFLRPLWLLDAGETLQGLQVVQTPVFSASVASAAVAVDGTSATSGAWTPAANTLYILHAETGVASGTAALAPSSITGNGTWTSITNAQSTVAASKNVGVAAYWFYSAAAGASATTTVNYASTQHNMLFEIRSVTNIYSGATATSPWTSSATPIVQSAGAADSAAPGSTTDTKVVTLAASPQTGLVMYLAARAVSGHTHTPQTGMTEVLDASQADASGSVGDFIVTLDTAIPPWTATAVGPATVSASTTNARAAIAWEMVPGSATAPGWVNCMVSAIEVR